MFVGVVASMVGLGGGVFLSPLFLFIGMHPQVIIATNAVIMVPCRGFFSSCFSCLLFVLCC